MALITHTYNVLLAQGPLFSREIGVIEGARGKERAIYFSAVLWDMFVHDEKNTFRFGGHTLSDAHPHAKQSYQNLLPFA